MLVVTKGVGEEVVLYDEISVVILEVSDETAILGVIAPGRVVNSPLKFRWRTDDDPSGVEEEPGI